MSLKIVLISPQIPQNTGNIARLTAGTKIELHLIKPLGFELSNKYLKRAGLDYWPEVNCAIHENWNCFLKETKCKTSDAWFFSTRAILPYYGVTYKKDDFLVFGSETKGLSDYYHREYETRKLAIPIDNPKIRSYNLSNSVAIVLFEAKRQLNDWRHNHG